MKRGEQLHAVTRTAVFKNSMQTAAILNRKHNWSPGHTRNFCERLPSALQNTLSAASSGGWTRSAKHAGASCRFEVSCNKLSCCADLKE